MVCKDEQTTKLKKSLLLSWLYDNPSDILQKARAENSGIRLSEYIQDLDVLLHSTFKRRSQLPGQRTLHSERVIIRYVVYMHLFMMDKGKNKNLPRPPLTAYRNPDTPVEALVECRLGDYECRGPSAAVMDMLNDSESFFSSVDRSHIRDALISSTNEKSCPLHQQELLLPEPGSTAAIPPNAGSLPLQKERLLSEPASNGVTLEPEVNPASFQNDLLRADPASTATLLSNKISAPLQKECLRPELATNQPLPSSGNFASVRVASIDETRRIHHFLLLHAPVGFDIIMHHHPMEVYVAWGLHATRHCYVNRGPLGVWPPSIGDLSSAKLVFSDTRPVEKCANTVMVARPGSRIYDLSFPPATFRLPIKTLLEFVVRHGKADESRSTGWRLDLSNAGQAFEDMGPGDVFLRPKTLCGDQVFRSDPDGPLVRAILGRLVDGVCNAGKLMCREMSMPHSLNLKRYTEYALQLQEFLFGKSSFVESITLQLLNLTIGDHGEDHRDVLNDHRASYDATMVKVMNFVDSHHHLYSLKIVCGFRKRLGDYYSVQMSKIERLLLHARTMLAAVDANYSLLVSHHKGSYLPPVMPTWAYIDHLHFDDHSPWLRRTISKTISQDSITILTGIGRGIWLSPALTSIYNLAPLLGESGMIQLLMVMSWQNSFQHFWEVCQRMHLGGETNRQSYPIYEYYRIAREQFHHVDRVKGQEMFGGEMPRFGPIGFDFKEVFGTNERQRPSVVDEVVGAIVTFLDEVNTLVDGVDCATVMDMVARTSERIRFHARCEIGSFRLMLLLQGCVYLRVRLRPGRHLRQIFFPVKGSGSWNHIKDMKVEDSQVESVCLAMQAELSTPERFVSMDEVEVILCESKDGRLLRKYDLVIKGQSLFKLDDSGASWMKVYGDTEWVEVPLRHIGGSTY